MKLVTLWQVKASDLGKNVADNHQLAAMLPDAAVMC
jgi:hypothetical protein